MGPKYLSLRSHVANTSLNSCLRCVVLGIVLVLPAERLWAYEPYALSWWSDYIVIDSSRSVVLSSGNIVDELLADPSVSPKLASLRDTAEIPSYSVDPVTGRLFLFAGKEDEAYEGILIVRLKDRKYDGFIKRKMAWVEKTIIPNGDRLYLEDQVGDVGSPKTYMYDRKSYAEINNGEPLNLEFSHVSCFLPGSGLLYSSRGLYDIEKKKKEALDEATRIWNSVELDCKGGKVLMVEKKAAPFEKGGLKLSVYDLIKKKFVLEFQPEDAGGIPWSKYEWQVTPDGNYVVWTETKDLSGKSVVSGRIVFYSISTGRKYWDVQLPALTERELQIGHGYHFKNFSVDGRKMIFELRNVVYVLNFDDKKISNIVDLSEYYHNSTVQYVVWP